MTTESTAVLVNCPRSSAVLGTIKSSHIFDDSTDADASSKSTDSGPDAETTLTVEVCEKELELGLSNVCLVCAQPHTPRPGRMIHVCWTRTREEQADLPAVGVPPTPPPTPTTPTPPSLPSQTNNFQAATKRIRPFGWLPCPRDIFKLLKVDLKRGALVTVPHDVQEEVTPPLTSRFSLD